MRMSNVEHYMIMHCKESKIGETIEMEKHKNEFELQHWNSTE